MASPTIFITLIDVRIRPGSQLRIRHYDGAEVNCYIPAVSEIEAREVLAGALYEDGLELLEEKEFARYDGGPLTRPGPEDQRVALAEAMETGQVTYSDFWPWRDWSRSADSGTEAESVTTRGGLSAFLTAFAWCFGLIFLPLGALWVWAFESRRSLTGVTAPHEQYPWLIHELGVAGLISAVFAMPLAMALVALRSGKEKTGSPDRGKAFSDKDPY